MDPPTKQKAIGGVVSVAVIVSFVLYLVVPLHTVYGAASSSADVSHHTKRLSHHGNPGIFKSEAFLFLTFHTGTVRAEVDLLQKVGQSDLEKTCQDRVGYSLVS